MITTGSRLQRLFDGRQRDDKVMSLFLTAGYPELESSAELILGFEKQGAELIELGMPFSDPLADGPTVQQSSEVAIRNGITMDHIFGIVEEVRRSSEIPLVLMGYINPVMNYGISRFCQRASEAGVDGLIIPDVTLEESGLIDEEAKRHQLSVIYLVAPNTSDERMRKIDERSSGFVYCVSVTGVTGARDGEEIARSVDRFISRVNQNITRNPKLIGFGIRSHEDAERVTRQADGFIVGSALIDTIRQAYPDPDWKQRTYQFVNELKHGKAHEHQ